MTGVATWGKARAALRRRILSFSWNLKSLGILGPEEQNCRMGIPNCGVVGSEVAGPFLTDTIISEFVSAKPPNCCYRVASG